MTLTSDPPRVQRPASRSPGRRHRRRPGGRRALTGLIFAAPTLLAFGFFSWLPLVSSVRMSFEQTNFLVSEFVGLDNFVRVWNDPLLGVAVTNTLLFAGLSLLIGFPIPLMTAIVVSELRRARQLGAVLAYLPVVIPPVVAVLLWKAMYNPGPDGVLNTLLSFVGLGPFAWLNDAALAIPAIVVQATWASFGTATIIYLAALASVRTDLYEAAEIDGSGIIGRIWHITLPQLRPVIVTLVLLQIIGISQLFTEPFVMTGGGPENRTLTVMMLVYRYAFQSGDYGRATALSVMLALVLGAVSALFLLATRRWSRI